MVKGGAKSFSTSIKLIKHHALKSYNFWKVGWGYTLSIIKWTSKMAASIVIEISQSWWDKLKMHKLASTELSVVTSPLTCKLYLLKKSVFATLIICLLPEAQMVLNGKKRKKSKIRWFFLLCLCFTYIPQTAHDGDFLEFPIELSSSSFGTYCVEHTRCDAVVRKVSLWQTPQKSNIIQLGWHFIFMICEVTWKLLKCDGFLLFCPLMTIFAVGVTYDFMGKTPTVQRAIL